jgi:hypothetical protein
MILRTFRAVQRIELDRERIRMFQDFRFGLKLLWKEKAFTITALLTLALCIGANTAIFTVLHAVILSPLPFPEPDRLVALYNIYPGAGFTGRGSNGVPDYFDRRELTDVFDSVALTKGSGFDMGSEGSPVRIDGESVTQSYFHEIGSSAALGRTFTGDEAVFQKDKFAILSYGLWKDVYARDANILGKDIRLSGSAYRIIGVMPDGFADPRSEARIWVPLSFAPAQTTDHARHNNSWDMVARLKPGVTLQNARQRIDALNKRQVERAGPLRKLLEDAPEGRNGAGYPAHPLPLAGRRGVCAADRLCERGQPDAGAFQYPYEGTGHPVQPGRGPPKAERPVAHRIGDAGRAGWGAGNRHRFRRCTSADVPWH